MSNGNGGGQVAAAETEFSEIVTIVVRAEIQQLAEDAAVAADPTNGAGTFVPGVPLRVVGDETNTVVAYWARWNMTQGQKGAFSSAMGGPNNILAPGVTPDMNRNRWFFDSKGTTGWQPRQALAALGFTTLAV